MKQIYLHIGSPKAGSSVIQNSLKDNELLLADSNISYIDTFHTQMQMDDIDLRTFIYHLYLFNNSPSLCDLLIQPDYRNIKNAAQFNNIQESFDALVKKSKDIIIISREHLFKKFGNIKILLDLCSRNGGVSVKSVILYLRRQDRFVESSFSEAIKGGRYIKIKNDDFYLEPIDYEKYLENIEAMLSDYSNECNLIARCYHTVVKKEGILNNFYNIIDPALSINSSAMQYINQRLTYEEAYILENFYSEVREREDPAFIEQFKAIMHTIDCGTDCKKKTTKVRFFTYDKRKQWLNAVYDSNKRVFEKFNMGESKDFNDWMTISEEEKECLVYSQGNINLARNSLNHLANKYVETQRVLNNRTNESRQSDEILNVIANNLRFSLQYTDAGEDLYIYAAGEHTEKLLQRLKGKIKFSGILDRLPNKRHIYGVPVYKREGFDYTKIGKIIISSKAFEDEIFIYLRQYLLPEQIYPLYRLSDDHENSFNTAKKQLPIA